MTTVETIPDLSMSLNADIERIFSLLTSRSLHLRDPRRRLRDMMDGIQPLSIDGTEISCDAILAELVAYATADQLRRETATWTLKKSVFGNFEASMTPIPKYCFTHPATQTAVAVHSVPRFSLDDILTRSEKEFPSRYTYKKIEFYSDWGRSILARTGAGVPAKKYRLLRTIQLLPKHLLPVPPHISRRERATLAVRILRIVAQHHRSGVYHDRISDRTIFFPTPYQPLFLSNYAGVPASMLADSIPAELLAADTTEKYGAHYRDVYCMALVSYRIMTGETIDGRQFSLESPRPLRRVLDEIARKTNLAYRHKNLSETAHTAVALYRTIRTIVKLLPSLFSETTFSAWRKINRATGGLWRSIPLVGPFTDIFLPTRCAAALRNVLDKSWIQPVPGRKNRPSGRPDPQFPAITSIAGTLSEMPSGNYPQFEKALRTLISDAGLKRMAFSSLMEGSAPGTSALFAGAPGKLVAGSAICLVVMMLFFLVTNNRHPHTDMLTTTHAGKSIASVDTHSFIVPEKLPVTMTPVAADFRAADLPRDTDKRLSGEVLPTIPEKTVRKVHESIRLPHPDTTLLTKTSVPNDTPATVTPKRRTVPGTKNITQKTTPALPKKQGAASNGSLAPATGFRDVFIVTGVTDSCNPGRLHFLPQGGKSTMMISQFPAAPQTLYMVHRTTTGFGVIAAIRLCRIDKGDPTMYYTPVGENGYGRPAYVRSGDVISPDKNILERFVKARLSLYQR